MVCSPEQLAANRRNSKRSTGPTSPEGKARSRRNSLKHGLTGAGVVLPDEDVVALEERFEAFEADLKPANDVARFLARRAALLSVRLDRSAREEAARITRDMLEADEVEQDIHAMELAEVIASLADHPAAAVRRLRRTEEGIAWLIEGWRLARLDLIEHDGYRWRLEVALRLAGIDPNRAECHRMTALDMATRGLFGRLEAAELSELEPSVRRAAARAELLAWVDGEIAGLEAARLALDPGASARLRAGAAARAIFDSSKGATLARKYEAASERDFYRALKKIEEINAAEAEAQPELETEELAETPEEIEACDELASSLSGELGGVDRFEGLGRWDRREAKGTERGRREVEMRDGEGRDSSLSSPRRSP